MHFRIDVRIRGLATLDTGFDLNLHFPEDVSVNVRRPTAGEIEEEEGREDVHCSAVVELAVPTEFEARVRQVTRSVAIESFTIETREELRRIKSKLLTLVTTVVNTMRWAANFGAPHNSLRNVVFSYCPDGVNWFTIQASLQVIRWSQFPLGLDGLHEILSTLLSEGKTEPIAHDLWREAWDHFMTDPRSALIMGMAAAEVGAKQCVATFAPQTSWLGSETSPPMTKLLASIIPNLLKQASNQDLFQFYKPPKDLRKRLDLAAQARNALIHHLPNTAKHERALVQIEYIELRQTLRMILDLLWLFDFYAGFSNKINAVSATTMQLLINENGGRALPHMASRQQSIPANSGGSFE